MEKDVAQAPENTIQFCDTGGTLFTIKANGTIERGPCFTTMDEMSLTFWELVESRRCPQPIVDLAERKRLTLDALFHAKEALAANAPDLALASIEIAQCQIEHWPTEF